MRAAAHRHGARAPLRGARAHISSPRSTTPTTPAVWLKRRYNSVMAQGERVIAISDFVARHVAATYGVAPERLRVVHRGIDMVRFDPERTGAERVIDLAREWGLPDGVPVVMLPGRLTRWKGHAVLIEALRRLDRSALHCVIVGSGKRTLPRASSMARDRSRSAALLGSPCSDECRDMPAAYMLADVVVSASIRARRLRPRHRRGAGDGAPGDRHRAWRRGRDGDPGRDRLAGAAGRSPTRSPRRSPKHWRSTPEARQALALARHRPCARRLQYRAHDRPHHCRL